MAAFATTSDLEARWRKLGADETVRAETLLEDAAAVIRAEGAAADATDAEAAELLKIVSCEMVKRAMLASPDQGAATQGSLTVGPFSESFTYANPTGDLYLTKAERRRLGIGGGRIRPWSPLGRPGGPL